MTNAYRDTGFYETSSRNLKRALPLIKHVVEAALNNAGVERRECDRENLLLNVATRKRRERGLFISKYI